MKAKIFSLVILAVVLFGGILYSMQMNYKANHPFQPYEEREITILEIDDDVVYYSKDDTGNYYAFTWDNAEKRFSEGETHVMINYAGSDEIYAIR